MSADGAQVHRPMRPELRKVQAYWDAKRRQDGGLPRRADIDPLELRFALGHLILTDVEPGAPPRFRHRLVGSHIVDFLGYDATGLHLDALAARQLAAHVIPAYREVAATGAPCVQFLDAALDDRYLRAEILRLPLAEDGRTVNMILSAAYFDRAA
ncbi:MAG: PAS domain-containing protein [Tagaea sp.]|nr:PAS domain-containing protein [Tagaea sp.]